MSRRVLFARDSSRFCALQEQDLGYLKTWRNDQMAVLRQTRPLTDEDQQNWFRFIQTDTRQVLFAILDPEEKFIGYCGLTNIDRVNQRGEVSFLVYTTCDDATYRILFLDALSVLCEYGFETLQLHKVFAEVFEFRRQTLEILEEYGFERTGRLKEHIWESGRFFDSIIVSILNPAHAHIAYPDQRPASDR